jgi:hypothetical protein
LLIPSITTLDPSSDATILSIDKITLQVKKNKTNKQK